MDVVLAITGASGAVYGTRLLEVLLAAGRRVHLVISPAAVCVIATELGRHVDLANFALGQLLPEREAEPGAARPRAPGGSSIFSDTEVDPTRAEGTVAYHDVRDFAAGIASGSFRTAGMVICPCSMGTLASIANGLSTNLIHRAAAVHLKERRKLIVVPRETPLDTIQLENMARLSSAGAVVLPAMPGFYHRPESIDDLVDFVVTRICDQLGVEVDLTDRWGE